MKKNKVLEIGPGNFGIGGRSVITWNWYQNWDYKKLQIDFLSCDAAPDRYLAKIKQNGGNFYLIKGFYNQLFIVKPIKKFIYAFKISKLNRYSCIHIHSSNSFEAFVYYLAVKPFCRRILVHSHNTNVDCNSSSPNFQAKIKRLLHTTCRYFLNNKNVTFLACSTSAAKWMFPVNIIKENQYLVIKNGITISKFIFSYETREKIRSELKLENKFVIGHIGRFAYQKNHHFLIDIFHKVYRINRNSILLLIGKGELENEIKRYVQNLGLENAVYFYGAASNTHDCFVFPSHFEGLGIVAIEAQAAGLKTLCADTVPKEAQITDLLEYMSLTESAEKWAEKVLDYSTGYKRKDMSVKIKKAGYGIEDSAKQLEKLYIN